MELDDYEPASLVSLPTDLRDKMRTGREYFCEFFSGFKNCFLKYTRSHRLSPHLSGDFSRDEVAIKIRFPVKISKQNFLWCFGVVFNKTINPLALVGYDLITANSWLSVMIKLISRARSWNKC